MGKYKNQVPDFEKLAEDRPRGNARLVVQTFMIVLFIGGVAGWMMSGGGQSRGIALTLPDVTVAPSITPQPTATPMFTATPQPTATPMPTQTPIPTPDLDATAVAVRLDEMDVGMATVVARVDGLDDDVAGAYAAVDGLAEGLMMAGGVVLCLVCVAVVLVVGFTKRSEDVRPFPAPPPPTEPPPSIADNWFAGVQSGQDVRRLAGIVRQHWPEFPTLPRPGGKSELWRRAWPRFSRSDEPAPHLGGSWYTLLNEAIEEVYAVSSISSNQR